MSGTTAVAAKNDQNGIGLQAHHWWMVHALFSPAVRGRWPITMQI